MSRPETHESPFARYIPLAVWLAAIVVLLLIPLRIIAYDYIPGGDLRRHVAQAFTDKPYTQILVLNSNYTTDHSPGWDGLLRMLRKAGWTEDALVSFSIVGLMLCIFYAPLPWLRRPEAWLAALLAQLIAIPDLMVRLTQARPLLVTEGVLIAILFGWSKVSANKPSGTKLTLTCLGVALSVWMHGAWYLWALPVMGFLMARAWKDASRLAVCVAVGILAGALFTGKPFEFLRQAILIISSVSGEYIPQRLLVGELRPSYGEFDSLILLVIVFLCRWLQTRKPAALLREPVFCVLILCWILGFKADRFWADWGVPAALVWLAIQFEALSSAIWDVVNPTRLLACVLVVVPLYLDATNDLDARYTFNLNEPFLNASDPALQGWLPADNGIFYSASMGFFYNSFFHNPDGNWRYILGLEPALMPPDDLQTFRRIQLSGYSLDAYGPWIEKMQPGDRLEIDYPGQPNIPKLEWHNAAGNIWIGRVPRPQSHRQ